MSHQLNMQSATTDIVTVPGIGTMLAHASAIPANSAPGYGPGCLFLTWSTFAAATQIYYNSGTATSSTWTALDLSATNNIAGLTATAAELNVMHGVTAGTGAASKGLVLDSGGNLTLPGSVTMPRGGKLGGLAYSNAADSTGITSTSTETLFDTNYAIPANTVAVGTVIKLRYAVIATSTNSTDTLTVKSWLATNTVAGSLAGVTLAASAATDAVNSDILDGEFTVVIRTLGSSGTCGYVGSVVKTEAASNTATRVQVLGTSTINTQTINTVGVSGQWSTTNAGNSALARVVAVEIY